MAMLKWTIEISVDTTWVADGFDFTKERAENMILNDLLWAYSHEVKAKIIKAPAPEKIAKIQGYSSVADMMKSR